MIARGELVWFKVSAYPGGTYGIVLHASSRTAIVRVLTLGLQDGEAHCEFGEQYWLRLEDIRKVWPFPPDTPRRAA